MSDNVLISFCFPVKVLASLEMLFIDKIQSKVINWVVFPKFIQNQKIVAAYKFGFETFIIKFNPKLGK